MLLKEFYRVINTSADDNTINVSITINPDHKIFKGHFPDQPVVPGVVQLQIIKELLEDFFSNPLMLTKVTQIKYLVPVIPDEEVVIEVKISIKDQEGDLIKVDAIIGNKETIYTKAKLGFAQRVGI